MFIYLYITIHAPQATRHTDLQEHIHICKISFNTSESASALHREENIQTQSTMKYVNSKKINLWRSRCTDL
jgi:hypothetical protein